MSKGMEVLDVPYIKQHSQLCTQAEKETDTPSLTQNPTRSLYLALFLLTTFIIT